MKKLLNIIQTGLLFIRVENFTKYLRKIFAMRFYRQKGLLAPTIMTMLLFYIH